MAENKVDYFTREGALRITEENLKDVRSSLRSKTERAFKAGENLVEAAAYATYGARQVMGEDFSIAKWADAVNGGRRTAVYLWVRMATALMDLGVESKTPEWTALVGKAAANASPVAWVLDGRGLDGKGDKGTVTPTRSDLDAALSILFVRDEDGTLHPEAKHKGADVKASIARLRGETVEDQTGDGADSANGTDPVENVRDIGARCKASAEYLATFLSELTPDQFVEVDPILKRVFKVAKSQADAVKAATAQEKVAS